MRRAWWGLIGFAIVIKAALFLFVLCFEPSSIMRFDSILYLEDAQGWVNFFFHPSSGLAHSYLRTPGYTLFLAIFHGLLDLPLMSVVFIQLALNVLTAIVVYRTALLIDTRWALLSATIVLLDLPTTIFSVMVLSESLHLFLMALFLFALVRYFKDRALPWLLWAGLMLALSIHVRPVGYFLGFAVAGLVVYFWGVKKFRSGIIHALIFLAVVHSVLGLWQYRNFHRMGQFRLSEVENATIKTQGFLDTYARETDEALKKLPPAVYFARAAWRMSTDLMFSGGNMKYFNSRPWKKFGAVFGYLVVIFWAIGFFWALVRLRKDIYSKAMLMILLYFLLVTVVAMGWNVTSRYRIAMLPCLALLSAAGWTAIMDRRSSSLVR